MTKQIVKMPPRALKKNPSQTEFTLCVDRQVDEDGIGMGVLNDGTPFLNQRGLALLCDVKNKYIGEITNEWNSENQSDRTKAIRSSLEARGELTKEAAHDLLYGRVRTLAYPDAVCMAILEHFAFDAGWAGQQVALENYRKLARHGLRRFIYDRVGYKEANAKDDIWRVFHDRVSLTYDSVPAGYFSVFKEISSLIVTMGLQGLAIDEHFVPDISVGQAWSRHWDQNRLGERYGARGTYPHNYPSYFPQSASNPQMAACYPEDAVGAFRRWFREVYVGGGKFQSYLTRKASEWQLSSDYVERAMLALNKVD